MGPNIRPGTAKLLAGTESAGTQMLGTKRPDTIICTGGPRLFWMRYNCLTGLPQVLESPGNSGKNMGSWKVLEKSWNLQK